MARWTKVAPKVVASRPAAMPALATQRKVVVASKSEKPPPTTAATAKRMQTRPEASLSSDSPSRMCWSRGGIGERLKIALTATGSVGERAAARAKATGSGMPGTIQCSRTPVPMTLKTTRPRAISLMIRASRTSPSLGTRQPSRNSSGSRKTRKNTSGSRLMPRSVKAAAMPPRPI